MVEETDINDPIIMGLTLSEDKIELLSKGINFLMRSTLLKTPLTLKLICGTKKNSKRLLFYTAFVLMNSSFPALWSAIENTSPSY